ncbi:MAG TPA: 50S ribosomal protein L10 [Dissulfurispiraceae bacterium]|nr:50S ribosomal protein L10 [Dissulfurispiraceae bacterium]
MPARGLRERRNALITKERKAQQVTYLQDRFVSSTAVLFTEYKGLTVAEMSDLRSALKQVGGEYKVVKNTLIRIASKGTPVEAAEEVFIGPTGIAFGFDDPIAAAKKVIEYAEKNDKFKLKSGVIEGKLCSVSDLKTIAKLPPRNVLLSVLAGTFQAPLTKLAGALNATVARFGHALEALKQNRS